MKLTTAKDTSPWTFPMSNILKEPELTRIKAAEKLHDKRHDGFYKLASRIDCQQPGLLVVSLCGPFRHRLRTITRSRPTAVHFPPR